MIQVDSREKTAFMETSTFKKAGENIRQGAWLYFEGLVETPELLANNGTKSAENQEPYNSGDS